MSEAKRLTYKDFVFKFDVVTAGPSDSEDYAREFLEYLSGSSLDRKYKLVFPLYYDFKLSADKKPELFMNSEAQYLWWIDGGDEKLVKGVQEHSKYGVGIARSYCKANVKPSFLEMEKADEEGAICVKVQLYDGFTPNESYLFCDGDDAPKQDDRVILDAQSGNSRWNLSAIKVNFESDQNIAREKLESNQSFLKGIKSHYPILENSNTFLYYFFSNNLSVSSKESYGFGGLFVISDQRLTEPELGFFMLAGYTLSNKIALSQIQRTARIEATKSAIAKAMARNMSHNIGSHVLSNLVKETIYGELSDARVKELRSYDSKREDLFVEDKNRQLAYFMRYLKSRMDYMSEVTFGSPSLLANRMISGDVMKEFDSNRILLNHISGIPGFKYGFSLKHGYRSMEEEDIAAAFPGDVIGCQAFYNIIENVIRNTAKHTRRQNGSEPTVFTIRFKEPEDCDDVKGADEMYCVEIGSDVVEPRIDEIVTAQNLERLNSPVFDESYNLRSHSLGLLEMEASAAFLRQLDLHEIESDNYTVDDGPALFHERNGRKRLNIIKAFAVYNGEKDEDGKKKGSLAYRFFVQKPKEFLFIGDWSQVDSTSRKTLQSKGVEFSSFDDFDEKLRMGKAFAHTYLLYDATLAIDFAKHNTLLPLRRIPVDDDGKKTLISYLKGESVFAELRDFVWTQLSDDNCRIRTITPTENTLNKKRGVTHVIQLHHPKETIAKEAFRRRRSVAEAEDFMFVERLSGRTLERMPCYNDLSRIGNSGDPEANYFNHFVERDWKDEDRKAYSWIVKDIADAYRCKVVVIDERIQKHAEENMEDGFPCWAYFEMTRVFIPRGPHRDVDGAECPPLDIDGNAIAEEDRTFIPLAPEDFGKYREKLEEYIVEHIDDAFLLIHYGVLERMYGKPEKIYKMLETWSKADEKAGEEKKPRARRVVVTSGRGSHSLNLPPSVCFVNLSSVLYSFCESRNKYLISVLLNQSRRKTNE